MCNISKEIRCCSNYAARRDAMTTKTYLDTLCDSELETVVSWLSLFPYPAKWEYSISDRDLFFLVAQHNPFQRPCIELLGNRVLPANILVNLAHIPKECHFEDWNFGELLREWSIESFAQSCGALKSISFDSLPTYPKTIETGYKRLMVTVGAQLTALSLRRPSNWMWVPIQQQCPNLRKLYISCSSADTVRPSFWMKVGRTLEELKIIHIGALERLKREKSNMRGITSIKRHCRKVKRLTLSGIREGSAMIAECLESFPALEKTELSARFWEHHAMQHVAKSCENVRVNLAFGNPEITPVGEMEVTAVLNSFGDRVDELELIDNAWFETSNAAPIFERALNKCTKVKKFSTQSRESTWMMFAHPKSELSEVSCIAQLASVHISLLAMCTRVLCKLYLQHVSPIIPAWRWKELMNANKNTLEEMDISTIYPTGVRENSTEEMDSFTDSMVWKYTEILQAVVDLPHLCLLKLNVGGMEMDEGTLRRFRHACVRLRRRRIHVCVNGVVLLPTGG